jgi:hypothetical protein
MRSATRTLAPVAARLRLWLALGVLAAAAVVFGAREATAQDSAEAAALTGTELAELVGPIALYPDDLVAIVLPASTYPLQVVEAARLLERREDNPSLQADSDWDDSVVALLNYPEVVRLMNDDLDWTYDLGSAVLNQRADVLDAIQGFRDRAYAAGNLRTDDRQTVTADAGRIAIAPADPEVIYVPYYEPERVIVYQRAPVYHYYPWAYPVYYYPYPAGYVFRTGFFWGVSSAFVIGWDTHLLHVRPYGYYGHPYFGRTYYDPFYVRNNVVINVNVNRGGYNDVWQPRHRYGGRPIVRGRDGYVGDSAPRIGRSAEGSAYRNRTAAPAVRTDGADRTRAPRGDATPGNTRRETVQRSGEAPRTPQPNRTRPDNTYTRQGPGGTANVNGGVGQALERNRARATQPTETARVPQTPQRAAPRTEGSAPGAYRNSAPRTRADNGGGTVNRSYNRETSRAAPEVRQAPRAEAPAMPSNNGAGRMAAPRESGYRNGGASGGRGGQDNGAARGGQGRSAQR